MHTKYEPNPDNIAEIYIDPDLSVKRVVVCAANKFGNLIIPGARHFDGIMNALLDVLGGVVESREHEQGFIDQYGIFITRKDALHIVQVNKQPLRDNVPLLDELYSENLY
jgi:hypothetical protein